MLDSEGIAGKRFLKFESVVELLKEEKEKGNLIKLCLVPYAPPR